MKLSKQQYDVLVQQRSPKSPTGKNCVGAFVIGGLICVLGQALGDLYGYLGATKMDAATLTSITLVCLSALLTGFGLYDDLAKIAGAGTLVPITGFANSVVSPALEFKTEGYVLGLASKLFIISGPVIVYGTLASSIYGLIYFICMGMGWVS